MDQSEGPGLQKMRQGCTALDENRLDEAAILFREAADLGETEGLVNLGTIYGDKKFHGYDCGMERLLYKRAFELGCSYGASNLAITYRERGNMRKYKHWIKLAADQGNEFAIEAMAGMTGQTSVA